MYVYCCYYFCGGCVDQRDLHDDDDNDGKIVDLGFNFQ